MFLFSSSIQNKEHYDKKSQLYKCDIYSSRSSQQKYTEITLVAEKSFLFCWDHNQRRTSGKITKIIDLKHFFLNNVIDSKFILKNVNKLRKKVPKKT